MRAPLILLLVSSACATTAPRFSQAVAASFVEQPMRVMTTPELELYYPAGHAPQAKQLAARFSECIRELRAHDVTQRERSRAIVFLTTANFDNAYVDGQHNGELLHAVVPTQVSDEGFGLDSIPDSDPSTYGCHELMHFVHFEQVENFWRGLNAVFGPLYAPQGELGRWFTEGIAQYYESKRGAGRLNSAFYRGVFDAFVAGRGVSAGDLNVFNRELSPYSGAYLAGLFFVEWLVQKHGEEKLWEVIDAQGRSFFSPFGVTLRFRAVYGSDLGDLISEWSSERERRARPASQRLVMDVAESVRLTAAHGRVAMLSGGNEEVATLRILDSQMHAVAERRLTELMPWRPSAIFDPDFVSGLSFTQDARFLFFVSEELTARGDLSAQLRKVETESASVVQVWSNLGPARGGCVSADGSRYTLVRTDGGKSRLVERDLVSGDEQLLYESVASLSAPQWNASGDTLVFSRLDSNGWNLIALPRGGPPRALTKDGAFNYGARFDPQGRVLFSRAEAGRVQVFRLALDSGLLERLSEVPYVAFDPAPNGGDELAVLDREGAQWSLTLVHAEALSAETLTFEEEPEPLAPSRTEPPLEVQSDKPYSVLENFDFFTVRALALVNLGYSSIEGVIATFGGALGGRDRLGIHTWAFTGQLMVPSLWSTFWLGYRNLAFAPLSISVELSRYGYLTNNAVWDAALSFSRRVFTVPISAGAVVQVVQHPFMGTRPEPGVFANLDWAAVESTPYAGVQRMLGVRLAAAAYQPIGYGNLYGDLRAELDGAVLLPFSRRNSFTLSLAGRMTIDAPAGYLRVGGIAVNGTFFTSTGVGGVPSGLPHAATESLRGYEDHSLIATRAAIGHARYSYTFVIDKGVGASTLWIFPPLFFRQVDVELFTAAAYSDSTESRWARVAGAALFLRMALGEAVSLSAFYQFAYRFDLFLPPLHVAGLQIR